jgi:predicted PurR-regulated permease PerM
VTPLRSLTAGDRFLRILWWIVALGVFAAFAWSTWVLLLPLAIGYLLSAVLAPPVEWLYRRGLPRGVAAALVLVGLLLTISIVLWVLAPSIKEQYDNLIRNSRSYFVEINQRLDGFFHFLENLVPKRELVKARASMIHKIGANSRPFESIDQLFNIFPIVENALIASVVTFFLLSSSTEIHRWFISLVPNRYFEMALRLLHRVQTQTSRYIRGQMLDCLANGLLIGGALWILDVPYSYFIGAFAGMANAVPLLGPIAGGIPAVLLAMLGATATPWWVIAVVLVGIHMLDNFFIYPYTVGHSLHIPPVAVILGIAVGGEVGGLLGMFVIVPLIGILRGAIIEFHASLRGYRIL